MKLVRGSHAAGAPSPPPVPQQPDTPYENNPGAHKVRVRIRRFVEFCGDPHSLPPPVNRPARAHEGRAPQFTPTGQVIASVAAGLKDAPRVLLCFNGQVAEDFAPQVP